MPCVSKPGCTHGIIVSLWLICYIQCGFSISYLSIPGIVAHDKCNISLFFSLVQFQSPMLCCAVVGRWVGEQGCWPITIYFKILACLISCNVFGLLSSLFILRLIIIIISIYIIIVIITIAMGIIFCIHTINIVIEIIMK